MGDYRKLRVWAAAHALTLDAYATTKGFPSEERYELSRQIRRSAASVPTNIAEGNGRESIREFARFCRIALGSANELDYQLLLARDLRYLDAIEYEGMHQKIDHVRRMLSRLLAELNRRIGRSPRSKGTEVGLIEASAP